MLRSAIYGSDPTKELMSFLRGGLQENLFRTIGNKAMLEGYEEGGVTKTLMHSAAGGISAAVTGGDFAAGALSAGVRELISPLSSNAPEKIQTLISSLSGAVTGQIVSGSSGAQIGYETALSGELYNRQLHQREKKWIKEHYEEFAKTNAMTPEQAKQLLTLAALGLVDEATNRGTSRLIKRGYLGDITQEDIRNAQKFIKGYAVGSYREIIDDQPQNASHAMFTATKYEYEHHDYDPNKPKGGLIDNSLDFIPAGRGAGVALSTSGKAGEEALRALKSGPSVALHSNPESKKMVLQVGDRTYTQLSKNSRSTRTRIFEDVPPRDRQAVIDKLTEGARDVTTTKGREKGIKTYDHPDGTRINVRTVSSSTEKLGEHLTVDIIIKGDKSNKLELKFINSSKTKRQTQ